MKAYNIDYLFPDDSIIDLFLLQIHDLTVTVKTNLGRRTSYTRKHSMIRITRLQQDSIIGKYIDKFISFIEEKLEQANNTGITTKIKVLLSSLHYTKIIILDIHY